MRPKVYLLLKGLTCFLLLFLAHGWVTVFYRSILQSIGFVLSLGLAEQIKCNELCSVRVIAYISLVLVTPRLTVVRRTQVLLCGLAVFAAIDIVGVYLWPGLTSLQPLTGKTFAHFTTDFIWTAVGELLLPVLLWVVAVDKHLGLFSPEAEVAEDLLVKRSFSDQ